MVANYHRKKRKDNNKKKCNQPRLEIGTALGLHDVTVVVVVVAVERQTHDR